jgi:esterase/lipase
MVFVILFLGYILIGITLYIKQRSFLYHPSKDEPTSYATMKFYNEGEIINVFVLNEGHKKAILYFGGNGESMAHSCDYIAAQFPEFTVYLMDYRGYGKSSGKATEEGLYSDALKLYDLIEDKYKSLSIGGRSLGSGIAMYVASKREVSKLALITPFNSIEYVAQRRYPFYPMSILLKDKYNSAKRVKDIKAKTLIVMAELDSIVPKESTQKLIDAFNKKHLEVVVIKNRGHNDISSDEKYYKIMQDFIGEG